MENEEKVLLESLLRAVKDGDSEKIDKLKYDNLFYGSNLLSVVMNYDSLSHIGINFNFGYQIIKKGTHLYRIRQFDENTDFSQSKEWSFPPHMPENRANKCGEPALYLGTTETVCLLETHIKEGQKYVLGEYIVQEDIKLGGFLDCEDYKRESRYLAGVILNAYLIAPCRSDKNADLFKVLDEKYKDLKTSDLQSAEAKNLCLPLMFGVLNKRSYFYKTTNRIIEAFKYSYPDGISYSSSFFPLATVGVRCSDHNVVLYKEGIKKVVFVKSEIKVNKSKISGVEVLKILMK